MFLGAAHSFELSVVAGTGFCMAVWWISEAIPIYATALLPAVVFPMCGVMPMKELAPKYFPQILFLFVGGFILAFALEKWQLHKRIALRIILATGTQPHRILLGFMLASYLLSWWILNTATVMMLLPAVLAVVQHLEQHSKALGQQLAVPLLLGVAFASSVGGTATLIGTAPNMYLAGFFSEHFSSYPSIGFAGWMAFGVPLSLLVFGLLYAVLRWQYFRGSRVAVELDVSYIREQYRALGPLSYPELVIGAVFLLTVLAWFFADPIVLGSVTIPGWTVWLLGEHNHYITESTIAIASALLLFLLPAGGGHKRTLVTWAEARKVPYGVLLLFGGGFALAAGVTGSGLDDLIGEQLSVFSGISEAWVVLGLCLFVTFFTELTSNTASTALLLPLVAGLATQSDIHPLLLMLPVTLSASYAFMLPVATPPNTIVFGSDRLTVREMARTGWRLNIVAALATWLLVISLGSWVFGW